MSITDKGNLNECLLSTNCFRSEWTFKNASKVFRSLISIASQLPRVTVLENKDNYWHAVVRSRVFRFPDDLEILKKSDGRNIQIRSSSRIGLIDLGVNQRRVDMLFSELQKII